MSTTGRELQPGAVVGGYRIDALISRGGMGVVYRATNVALNRIYALKVLAPDIAEDPAFRERFKREIRTAASLHHPNVVAIHYAGDQDGLLFLAMDLIDGTDLREVILRSGALDPERSVGLLLQLTSALDAAHQRGLVHRDVKPANVLISVRDGEEHAFLTDFGLAKRFDGATTVTAAGAVVGTVDYMSPEQVTGGAVDARSDIYSLGCVLFQMLTGQVPYKRDTSVATLFAHVHEPPPPLIGAIAEAHPTLEPVLAKAMAKEPGDRYLSAGDLGRDAAAALEGVRATGGPRMVATGEARPGGGGAEEVPAPPVDEPDGASGPPTTIYESSEPAPPPAPPEPAPAAVATGAVVGGAAAGAGPAPRTATPVADGPAGSAQHRSRWVIAGAVVLLAAVGVVVALAAGGGGGSGSSSGAATSAGTDYPTALTGVPTNRVTGTGRATVRLDGTVATVTVTTSGLLNAAPHAMHIHAGRRGICPPASAARLHNGNLAISTTDGAAYYGPVETSLTRFGDTSPRSKIDFTRYPTVGSIRYKRIIHLTPKAASEIRRFDAVVVVHGIDYNGNGLYDNTLDRSDLSPALTGESTAPALCGRLATTAGGATASTGRRARTTLVATLTLRRELVAGEPALQWICHLPRGSAGAATT